MNLSRGEARAILTFVAYVMKKEDEDHLGAFVRIGAIGHLMETKTPDGLHRCLRGGGSGAAEADRVVFGLLNKLEEVAQFEEGSGDGS